MTDPTASPLILTPMEVVSTPSPKDGTFLEARIATLQLETLTPPPEPSPQLSPQPSPQPSPRPSPRPSVTATQSTPSIPQLTLGDCEIPTLRHKSSQTWHHSGPQTRTSPRISPIPSPRGLRARQNSSPVHPISLPPASSTTTSDSLVTAAGGLVRRVSQKAANKLRRRTSSAANDHEERTGPVLVRNRGESQSGDIGRLGIQHHDLDDDETAVTDQVDGPNSLLAPAADAAIAVSGDPPNGGILVPEELQRGTPMTRITRKKKTTRTFKLDVNKARVSWDPTKQSSRFYVDDMKEIRTGANARNYREELQISSDHEDRWITITYVDNKEGGKLKLLHVVAPTVELFNTWTTTLEAINRFRTEMMAGLAMQGEKFVDAHWRNYMATKRASDSQTADKLTFEDVERLCRDIHVNCSRRLLKEKFKRADRDNSGHLNFHEFERFVKLLKEREEIKGIWEGIVANPLGGMVRHEFQTFLRDVQKVDVAADSAQVDKVFRKFCRQSFKAEQADGQVQSQGEDIENMRMDQEAFTSFLLSSSYNPPLLASSPNNMLDRPLNEYYCSSSHNTYLMGRQVRGESSVEGYIRVLQRGCRCVEIDCWDGDDGRPVVTHGHTGTSECLFSDVIAAIGKYAFLASPYPVILSLEVHCGLEQQVKMAEHLVNILGEKLVTDPFMTNSMTLPSPQELKHRILVKVKGSERKESALLKNDFDAMERRTGSGSIASSTSPPKRYSFLRNNSGNSTSTSNTSESDDGGSGSGEGKKKEPKPTMKIAHELGKLGVYCRGQKFRNFALPESKTFNHIFSFQEKSLLKFCKDPEKKAQLEKHNVRYLMRVYPSGFRVNSSNFDPLGFWRRGVQMVALNWQTYDLGVQLNEAMFASADDKGGYVLKPKVLRGSRTTFDPPADAADAKLKKDKKQVSFSIKVISAQQLSRSGHKADDTIDPYVEVEVFTADDKTKGTSTSEGGIEVGDSKGISGLGAPQKRRTKVVYDDGFHPIFQEKMKFSLVTKFEDLVFVRFSVYNSEGGDDKSLIATYTAKLISLQQGYRHLPLYNIQGEQYLFSRLFVKINVDPVVLMDTVVSQRSSAIESIKDTIKSGLGSVGFSADRHSIRRKKSVKNTDKDKDGKATSKHSRAASHHGKERLQPALH